MPENAHLRKFDLCIRDAEKTGRCMTLRGTRTFVRTVGRAAVVSLRILSEEMLFAALVGCVSLSE